MGFDPIKKCPFQSNIIIDQNGILTNSLYGAYTTFTDSLYGSLSGTSDDSYNRGYDIDIFNLLNSSGEVVTDSYYVYSPCIQNACELWDDENKRCGAKTSDILSNGLDVDASGGADIPAAATLISEFMGNEDLDGDGKIYGVDFSICDDGEKPPMLKSIENSPYWPNPSPGCISWSEYLESIEDETVIIPGDPIYTSDIGKYVNGGYYTGDIEYNEKTYSIYVSPINLGSAWKSNTYLQSLTYVKVEDKETEMYESWNTDLYDGHSNTQKILNIISYDDYDGVFVPNINKYVSTSIINNAPSFIRHINFIKINGYDDWYIPSLNELLLIAENIGSKDMTGTDWINNNQYYDDTDDGFYISSSENGSNYFQAVRLLEYQGRKLYPAGMVYPNALKTQKARFIAIRRIEKV